MNAEPIMGSVVLRHMRRSPYFHRREDASLTIGEITAQIPLQPGETIVGIYENPPPWEECRIVFTDAGLH